MSPKNLVSQRPITFNCSRFFILVFISGSEGTIEVKHNPDIHRWSPETIVYKLDKEKHRIIDIRGNNLGDEELVNNYNVKVGSNGTCRIEDGYKLASNNLPCQLPSKEPRKHSTGMKNGAHHVVVNFGNCEYSIGYVKFYNHWWDDPDNLRILYAVLGTFFGFIILILIVYCLCVKRMRYQKLHVPSPDQLLYQAEMPEQESRPLMEVLKDEDRQLYESVEPCRVDEITRLTRFDEKIGGGYYGIVFAGEFKFDISEIHPRKCAIKTIKCEYFTEQYFHFVYPLNFCLSYVDAMYMYCRRRQGLCKYEEEEAVRVPAGSFHYEGL